LGTDESAYGQATLRRLAREFLKQRKRHPQIEAPVHECPYERRKPPEMSRAAIDERLAV
jgi:hypothetical protein